ncbi:MAG: TetR/AcrR family transcriptional regulator [Bacteroidota bacterium]
MYSAIRLFNEHGFVNVRLQHISDDTIISVGNIAYHFRNKEAIVSTIFESLEQELKEALIEYRNTPIFENIERIFVGIEAVQERYRFFFTDLLEIKRAYPDMFTRLQALFEWQTFMFQEILRFNTARAAIRALREAEIKFLAQHIIQSLNSWPAMMLVAKESEEGQVNRLAHYLWQILMAYMTEGGLAEYQVVRDQTIKY